MRASPTRLWIWAAGLLALAACIERAPTPGDRRAKFDRGRIASVLLTEMPAPARKVGAVYGGAVELIGTDWSPAEPTPGESVTVTFYYRVLDESDEDYKVFVHIDDRSGRNARINGDHWPAASKYPTGTWRRGEVIRDTWTFAIPGYYTAEYLDLWTGFYQPGKDARWPLTNSTQVQNDGQNRALAASIKVQPAR